MRIGIFGSEYQADKKNILRRLFAKLETMGVELSIEKRFFQFLCETLSPPHVQHIIEENSTLDFDIALSVGGDGTFLRTASRTTHQRIPILGINTGRLGFLADISSVDIEQTLDEVCKNYYSVEERTLLHLLSTTKPLRGYPYALNEIAILKRDSSSMITIHTYIDDEYLTSYQADGLIVATPTGSTAYSMSVGGPIILPQCQNIVLSPVAPHTLNVRPLIISDTCKIRLQVESRNKAYLISIDGRSEIFPADAHIEISKANHTIPVIKRNKHTFYETLRDKLMWGKDTRLL